MAEIYVLQHVACETLGTIALALDQRGIAIRKVSIFEEQVVPAEIGDAAGLIVMGGPMGVYEEETYPFLKGERQLIESALRAERPILGVCLGSQLLASVLGAPVTKGERKELGWHAIKLTESAATDMLWQGVVPSFVAYHWHGDVYPLPAGATPLASSRMTPTQAFRVGRNAYGLLFHMEVTAAMISTMVDTFADEAAAAGVDGTAIKRDAATHSPVLNEIGETVFRRWAALIPIEGTPC